MRHSESLAKQITREKECFVLTPVRLLQYSPAIGVLARSRRETSNANVDSNDGSARSRSLLLRLAGACTVEFDDAADPIAWARLGGFSKLRASRDVTST